MVTKHSCDKCGKEIKSKDEFKTEFYELFDDLNFSSEEEINKPELCKECLKGYKKIIAEANKKIVDYIKN